MCCWRGRLQQSADVASHTGTNTATYFGAHHIGTHQPFTAHTSHNGAHTCTHTATNAATLGDACELCWVVVGLW